MLLQFALPEHLAEQEQSVSQGCAREWKRKISLLLSHLEHTPTRTEKITALCNTVLLSFSWNNVPLSLSDKQAASSPPSLSQRHTDMLALYWFIHFLITHLPLTSGVLSHSLSPVLSSSLSDPRARFTQISHKTQITMALTKKICIYFVLLVTSGI